jgi:hypothetical protein
LTSVLLSTLLKGWGQRLDRLALEFLLLVRLIRSLKRAIATSIPLVLNPEERRWPIGEVRRYTLSTCQSVDCKFKGEVTLDGYIPAHIQLGDTYKCGGAYWVRVIPAGATKPTWINP